MVNPQSAQALLDETVVPAELLDAVTEHAAAFDSGQASPRELFPSLAAAGLLDLGAPFNQDGALVTQAAVIASLAQRSLSAAFALWGHRMSVEGLSLSGGSYAEKVLPGLRAGTVPGVSGMASAFKEYAGAGDLALSLERDEQGRLRLSGRLPWASNLYPDAVVVSAAYGPEPDSESGERSRYVIAFPLDAEGVQIGKDLNLLALQGTASSYVTLDQVVLGQEQVLSEDFQTFMTRCRPTFSILQSSFCLGLATASIEHAAAGITGINEVFAEEFQQLSAELAEAAANLADYARRVATGNPPPPRRVLELRMETGRLAVAGSALEIRTAGGKGYVRDSAPNRRYREATFIPVQSPSEAQLRWELARSEP